MLGALERWETTGIAAIDGQGGVHRYFIFADGEVVYSRSHGRGAVDEARAAGFRSDDEAARGAMKFRLTPEERRRMGLAARRAVRRQLFSGQW